MDTKTCSTCGIDKPLTDFHRLRDAYRADCKDCRRAYQRTYYRACKERKGRGGLELPSKRSERREACDKETPPPASPAATEAATITPVEPEVDRLAHLRRVPECKCRWIDGYHRMSPSCEVHFACQIDTAHNRTPAAINYTDF